MSAKLSELYLNGSTSMLELENTPNVKKIEFQYHAGIRQFHIGKNVGTNVKGFTVQPIVESIWNEQKSNPTLQSLHIENVNWTNFDVEALSWLADRPTCELKGTIAIKEDDPYGNPRVTWDLKNKFNAKFGNVDNNGENHQGLLMTYKRKTFNPSTARIYGNFYPESGNEFLFKVLPNSIYENSQYNIGFSIGNAPSGVELSSNGLLIVRGELPNSKHVAVVYGGVSYFNDSGAAAYEEIRNEFEIWN